jgi:hypothetical protein
MFLVGMKLQIFVSCVLLRSLLGGVYVTPKEHEGESIYSIFHVQEAVLLVPRATHPKRSLVIGLGPAIAARGLQARAILALCPCALPLLTFTRQRVTSSC